MKGSRIIRSTGGMNTRNTMNSTRFKNLNKVPPLTQKSKEDDYISSLQKQVYYLELEMKLMKDRELETKNKVGGFEVLFRDGVPLNENFLALKTKYKNERDNFENTINNLNDNINNTEEENENLKMQIDQTNQNYFNLIKQLHDYSTNYQEELYKLNNKYFNELNTLSTLNNDKNKLSKDIFRFTNENTHHERTKEKIETFRENNDEKNEKIRKYPNEKFKEVDRLTERSILELDSLERKMMNNGRIRQLEEENMDLLSKITKLERDTHMAEAKIAEIENSQTINKKYLLDEELNRNIHLDENIKLNKELDGLSKLNEEILKEKVKESEERQILVIKNQQKNEDLIIGLLNDKLQEDEKKIELLQ